LTRSTVETIRSDQDVFGRRIDEIRAIYESIGAPAPIPDEIRAIYESIGAPAPIPDRDYRDTLVLSEQRTHSTRLNERGDLVYRTEIHQKRLRPLETLETIKPLLDLIEDAQCPSNAAGS
jgi:hypothetical protein